MAARAGNLARDDRGDLLIEFALSLCVLLALLFGVMDFSRATYACHFLPFAAAQATRYAAVRGSTWAGTACATVSTMNCDATASDVGRYVQSLTPPGLAAASIQIATTWPGTTVSGTACSAANGANSPDCLVKVVVSYRFGFVLPFLPNTTLPFTASSEKAVIE